MELAKLSLEQAIDKLNRKETTSVELTKAVIAQAKAAADLNALITVFEESALKAAVESDKARAAGKPLWSLAGVPVGVKDCICIEGTKLTCASKALENYISPYTATAAQKLIDAGAVIVAKANMDEFGAGNRNETSAFGRAKNPVDPTRVTSGGSATAVAAFQCYGGAGTDSGGGIRMAAAYCGLVGLKPTYGLISRHGVMAYSGSVDCVGPLTRTVADNAILLDVMAGHDPLDMTSAKQPKQEYYKNLKADVKGLKVGVVNGGCALAAAAGFKAGGATVSEIKFPYLDAALGAYVAITSAEAMSNLNRIDGIRYGLRQNGSGELEDVYFKSRTAGFGKAVKQTIMLGNYVLSKENLDKCFFKAKKIQKFLQQEFDKLFKQFDLIVSPTVDIEAPVAGEASNPTDAKYAVVASLAGIPAISVPCCNGPNGLPMGLQIMANKFNEQTLLNAALFFERAKEGVK
ncbi:MAG: aspartyl/glutamyl-tRNA amidotransferase subunit A [Firmicutes bacterium]|nr:aspartyl/glutamyl-tRNA amidotransferase subunit A [Bacillota bacterium]